MPAEPAPAPPRIPGLRILEPLGSGGMGTLWLAARRSDGRLEVVKQMRTDAPPAPTAHARFVREAALACRIDHPNWVRGLGVGETETGPYLRLAFVAGGTLDAFRRSWAGHRVPVAVAVGLAVQMLDALAYAHRLRSPAGAPLRFVHRDLSPRNVMIDFDGRVKLLDLGLAHVAIGAFRTEPGVICGTPHYMSPEQARAGDVDARSDLYTVASVLYELLTGAPTTVRGEHLVRTLASVVLDEPTPVDEVRPEVPGPLAAVVMRGLTKAPETREPTAEAFAAALRAAAPEIAGPEALATLTRGLFPDGYARVAQRPEATRIEDPVLLDSRPKRPDTPAPKLARPRDDTRWRARPAASSA